MWGLPLEVMEAPNSRKMRGRAGRFCSRIFGKTWDWTKVIAWLEDKLNQPAEARRGLMDAHLAVWQGGRTAMSMVIRHEHEHEHGHHHH